VEAKNLLLNKMDTNICFSVLESDDDDDDVGSSEIISMRAKKKKKKQWDDYTPHQLISLRQKFNQVCNHRKHLHG
jgi:hypothetical protein